MPIALTDTHRELESVARAFLENVGARGAARDLLDAPTEELPKFWPDLVDLGWLGLHLPEEVGGSGYGLPELVVVLQELGRAAAPGPFLPDRARVDRRSRWPAPTRNSAELLPALADGSRHGALGLGGDLRLEGETLRGDGGVVLGAGPRRSVRARRRCDDVVVVDAMRPG